MQPIEIYKTFVQHDLDTPLKVYAFAVRQYADGAGDMTWLQWVMKTPPKKLKETIGTAMAMFTSVSTIRRQSLSHMDLLREALRTPCLCGGRAIPGWCSILSTNGIDVDKYFASIRQLFEEGGGKGLNHFYLGDPSTGKTALTRPILALFGDQAFAKPQAHTTFPLFGLIGAKAVVWNEFRWPLPPLAWGDLLNLFDNEAFYLAVPKTDGQQDLGFWASIIHFPGRVFSSPPKFPSLAPPPGPLRRGPG